MHYHVMCRMAILCVVVHCVELCVGVLSCIVLYAVCVCMC